MLAYSSVCYGQSGFIATLPEPGKLLTGSTAFTPVLLRGVVVHPDKPLDLDFLIDSGQDSILQPYIQQQSERLVRYFLAALTVPEDSIWVNLSPYEKDRIIDDHLSQTLLGRDMLAQDYVLKQLAASLIYPEKGLGKEFWDRIYKEVREKFGTCDIPMDAFNKVWIVPEKAEVYEKDNAVYVTQAKLKVMLDSDYLATAHEGASAKGHIVLPANLFRQIIIPALEHEVNEGQSFAVIRQVYHAVILAKWYRSLVQDTLIAREYIGKNKINGIINSSKAEKERIYLQYVAAFKAGVFNFVKEEADQATGENVPRRYFSGGIAKFGDIRLDHAQGVEKITVVGRLSKVDFSMTVRPGPRVLPEAVEQSLHRDESFAKLYAFVQKINPLFDGERLLKMYDKYQDRLKKRELFSPYGPFRVREGRAELIFDGLRKKAYEDDWMLYKEKSDRGREQITDDPNLSELRDVFHIQDVKLWVGAYLDQGDVGSLHYGVYEEERVLSVPEEAKEFAAFFMFIPRNEFRAAIFGPEGEIDPAVIDLYHSFQKVGLSVDKELLQQTYNKYRDKISARRAEGDILVANYIELYKIEDNSLDEIITTFGRDRKDVVGQDPALLDLLQHKFGIKAAYREHSYKTLGDSDHVHDKKFVKIWLDVPDEARELVLFYLTVPRPEFERIFQGNDQFRAVLEVARKINPDVDIEALRALVEEYAHALQGKNAAMHFPGKLTLAFEKYKFETYEESLEVPNREERIDSDPMLDVLKNNYQLSGVYKVIKSESYIQSDAIDHYGAGYMREDLFYPPEYADFLYIFVAAGEERVRDVILGRTRSEGMALERKVRSSIRVLGKGAMVTGMGNKEIGFHVMDRLGLPYPAGVVITKDLARILATATEAESAAYLPYLEKVLQENGVPVGKEFIVRSNPRKSMPGILESIGPTRDLLAAVRLTAGAWFSDKARKYRQWKGMDDEYDLSLIVQAWHSGKSPAHEDYARKRLAKEERFLYAAGVISTRDPDTNKEGLFGNYRENAFGAELMTGGQEGIAINKLSEDAPLIYAQLFDAKSRLEAAQGPQEVEFVINDGQLYFTQIRRIHFSPQAEINYLQGQMAKGLIPEAHAVTILEALQKKLGNRKLYKLRQKAELKVLARAKSSSSGALRGRLVWNMEKARHWMDKGEAVVMVSHEGNRNAVLDVLFEYPAAGLITNYGDSMSHEAVLCRDAGVPSLINLVVKEWGVTAEKQSIILEGGQTLEEGDIVILDGDMKALLTGPQDALEENGIVEDTAYGLRIPELRKEFTAPYLNEDGSIKAEYTRESLEIINSAAARKFRRLAMAQSRLQARSATRQSTLRKFGKAKFVANLQKHFLHDLLTQREREVEDKAQLGGIDLGDIDIAQQGAARIKFNEQALRHVFQGGFNGFTPVFIKLTPLNDLSVFFGER